MNDPTDPAEAQIRDLYSRLHERQPAPMSLPVTWIDAVVSPAPSPLRPGSRVLVAGCGQGHELPGFAALPGVEVVGVDFSEVALERARTVAGPEVQLVCGDLTDPGLVDVLGRFDFILCNAVADYVPDASALLQTLSSLLSEDGALYLGSNTQHHVRERFLAAMQVLSVDADDDDAVHHTLRVLDAARPHAPDVGGLERAVIDIDLLVPFAHHLPLETWCVMAEEQGLHLQGSLSAPTLVSTLPDHDLPPLYPLGAAGLARLMDVASDGGGRGVLFTHRPPLVPPFANPEALDAWRPRGLGLDGVPELSGDPHAVLPVVIQISGWGDWIAHVPAWVLELARVADGTRTVAELRANIPHGDDDGALVPALYRLWLNCLLRLTPPP